MNFHYPVKPGQERFAGAFHLGERKRRLRQWIRQCMKAIKRAPGIEQKEKDEKIAALKDRLEKLK